MEWRKSQTNRNKLVTPSDMNRFLSFKERVSCFRCGILSEDFTWSCDVPEGVRPSPSLTALLWTQCGQGAGARAAFWKVDPGAWIHWPESASRIKVHSEGETWPSLA
jgi:hypothetical protein